MKKLLAVFLIGILLVATGSSVFAEVRLCGSTTVQKRVMEPGKEALKSATGISVLLIGSGTGKGMESLVKGECDAAMASEELPDAVASLKAASGVDAPAGLQPHVITSDVIKVIVHPSNPVAKLSKEQLKGLNTGKITSWKEVGGNDAFAIVVTSHAGSATKKVFQKIIMDNEPYVKDAIQVETTRKEIDEVGSIPEAVGAVSAGFLNLPEMKGRVKMVESPEISRPLMLVTKGDASPDVKKILDFFRGEGKKHIKD